MGHTESFKVEQEIIKKIVTWLTDDGNDYFACRFNKFPYVGLPEFKSFSENLDKLHKKYSDIEQVIKRSNKYERLRFYELEEISKIIELKSLTHTLTIKQTIKASYCNWNGQIDLDLKSYYDYKLYIGNSLFSCLHKKFDYNETDSIISQQELIQKIKTREFQSLKL